MILLVAALAPKVFISYTHDSPDHKERIGWLADRLRCDEVDVRIDQAVRDTPAEGWPKWMEDEITSADYILLVCTETYGARYRGEGDHADGRGSRWETSLIRDILYNDPASISRFIPLLPRNATAEDIPLPLRHRATHFQIDDYYGLLEHVTDADTMVRAVWRREPGGEPDSPRERVGGDEATEFSASISEAYRRIDERVEVLTQEQYGVISRLQGRSRALISGNPGSGKTLVAAQKAILLAEAGVATLFVCHNPLLARWVRELTHDAPVDVYYVEELVQRLVAESSERASTWTEYSQPRSDQIAIALQRLESGPPPYQAVIVDEGQDFADEWWPLIEACTPAGDASILYVFFDDQQSLLPYRMNLPPAGWPLSLSRNCRNAGRIYRVMRRMAPHSPLPDDELKDLGHVRAFHQPRLRDALTEAIAWCAELDALDGLAAVLGGSVSYEESLLARGPFAYGRQVNWRYGVKRELWSLAELMPNQPRGEVVGPVALLLEEFKLSSHDFPTEKDVEAVARVARAIAINHLSLAPEVRRSVSMRWRQAQRGDWRPMMKSTRVQALNALKDGSWVDHVPITATLSFAPHHAAGDATPVYSVGEIKGLERQAILLLMQGDAPMFTHQLFVGVSRARAVLAVVADDRMYTALPGRLRVGEDE